MKWLNSWKLKRWQSNLLYSLFGLIYRKKIQTGDMIKCFGIGYPHWKGQIFQCDLDFGDGTIGIRNSVRVNGRDFRVI
jgi:hypothetical protein